jgi:hypothetical protein
MNLDQAKREFSNYVNLADPSANIFDIHHAFVLEKMKMDLFFSKFLDETEEEMNQSENYDSPAWITYRSKLKEYDDVTRFITHSKYYLSKHV